jgi:hypothetical protein
MLKKFLLSMIFLFFLKIFYDSENISLTVPNPKEHASSYPNLSRSLVHSRFLATDKGQDILQQYLNSLVLNFLLTIESYLIKPF